MVTNYLVDSPRGVAIFQNVQQQMVDRFQRVVPAGQSVSVTYVADLGEVRADIEFVDEVSAFGAPIWGTS